MDIEHVYNMYNQIIVYLNDRFKRIAITEFLRDGHAKVTLNTENMSANCFLEASN